MLKRFWKEGASILLGIGFAYCWQLFALLFVKSRTAQDFIPVWGIQLAIAPIMTWIAFGLFKVSWIKTYFLITGYVLAITIPMALVFSVGILGFSQHIKTIQFWVIALLITAIFAIPFARGIHNWHKQLKA